MTFAVKDYFKKYFNSKANYTRDLLTQYLLKRVLTIMHNIKKFLNNPYRFIIGNGCFFCCFQEIFPETSGELIQKKKNISLNP